VPLIGYLLSFYEPYSGITFALVIGVSQIVYLGPAMWILYRRGKPDTVKGVGIAAAVTFLLNAACFGVVALDPLVH
jgi:hypothetical protein